MSISVCTANGLEVQISKSSTYRFYAKENVPKNGGGPTFKTHVVAKNRKGEWVWHQEWEHSERIGPTAEIVAYLLQKGLVPEVVEYFEVFSNEGDPGHVQWQRHLQRLKEQNETATKPV